MVRSPRPTRGGSPRFTPRAGLAVIVNPLVAMILGLVFFYHSRDFIELLLAQPVRRSAVFLGKVLGISFALTGAFLVGVWLLGRLRTKLHIKRLRNDGRVIGWDDAIERLRHDSDSIVVFGCDNQVEASIAIDVRRRNGPNSKPSVVTVA